MAVDTRALRRVLLWVALVGLVGASVGLMVSASLSNAGINRLRHHGRVVTATVSGCEGLLGGSGSNGVGYTCRADFSLGGRTWSEVLPGTSLRAPGSHLALVVAPTDPRDLATPAELVRERASWLGFVWAGLLLAAALALGLRAMAMRRRGNR
ncbi:MAG TPA: hypothetical protein VNF50_08195 [Acidimicrobiales bacterium]|nr:hypothetical protein [Acidimicrobiales bacterium]